MLSGEEMQYIVDNLFVGNKLSTAEMVTGDGVRLDLRKIRSPIVCLCSKGDNITPPQQALGWILDLYESEDDILAAGQTIVYAVHETVGHLGIFVSGSVAKKEHQEFANNIDLIDCLPPGLYEAVIQKQITGCGQCRPGDRRPHLPVRKQNPGRHSRPGREHAGRGALLCRRGPFVRGNQRSLPHRGAADHPRRCHRTGCRMAAAHASAAGRL